MTQRKSASVKRDRGMRTRKKAVVQRKVARPARNVGKKRPSVRRAEKAIADLPGFLNLVIDNVPGTVAVKDARTFRYVVWNQASERLLSITREQALGKTDYELFPKEQADTFRETDLRAIETRAMVTVSQEPVTARHLGVRSFHVKKVPIVAADGTVSFIVAFADDITERQKVDAQLRQAQKMEAIGNLTGGIAHDFNNILAIVVGNLDLLALELPPGGEARELIETAIEAALKGSDLTKSLLAFSRRQPLQPTLVRLNDILAHGVKMLARTIGETIAVEVRLGDGLWDVHIDAAQLEAALLNMMVNSRDAMPHGGRIIIETANVRLDEHYESQNVDVKAGDYVLLSVSDTGHGMPPEILERVFEPFFTTKDVGHGTGLGLAMVFGFVKQSEGHIKIYSEVGHGTTVRLYLPRSGSVGTASAEDTPKATLAVQARNEMILVVEDNAAVRRAVAKQLKGAGYRVLQADDVPSALRTLETADAVDLVFSDVVMPGGMTGGDLAREVKRRWPGTKVLLTSGFPQGLLRDGGKLPDDVALLGKPYRLDQLLRRFRDLLEA